MMFEMKLERCFITSYAWVPSYLLSDSLCFGYDSFHLWTNELLFCENRARSFVSCRGSGWTSASLLTRQGLPLVQNEPLIYGMVPCIRNLILLIQTGDTFPKTRSRTVWIRFEFLEFRFCRNRGLWKKKSFWYLFSLECFCAEPPHKSRLSVHRPTLCWEKRGLEIRASSLFYRLLGTVGVPRLAYPDVDDTKADADRTPAQRREREVAPRTIRRRKRPASQSHEEHTGPPFAQRRANACISPL